MIKKILLTIAALPVSSFVSIVIVFVFMKISGQTIKSPVGIVTTQAIIMLYLALFILFVYLIWKNIWKTLFVFFAPAVLLALYDSLFHHILGLGILNIALMIEIILVATGFFSYGFKIKLFSRKIWKMFIWFCVPISILFTIINIFPQTRINISPYLLGNSELGITQPDFFVVVLGLIIFFIVQISGFVCLYRLAYKNKK